MARSAATRSLSSTTSSGTKGWPDGAQEGWDCKKGACEEAVSSREEGRAEAGCAEEGRDCNEEESCRRREGDAREEDNEEGNEADEASLRDAVESRSQTDRRRVRRGDSRTDRRARAGRA